MKISLKSFALAAIALASLHSARGNVEVQWEGVKKSPDEIVNNTTTTLVSLSCSILGYATASLMDSYKLNWQTIKSNKIVSTAAFVVLSGLASCIWNNLPDYGYMKYYLDKDKKTAIKLTNKKSLIHPLIYFWLGYSWHG